MGRKWQQEGERGSDPGKTTTKNGVGWGWEERVSGRGRAG